MRYLWVFLGQRVGGVAFVEKEISVCTGLLLAMGRSKEA